MRTFRFLSAVVAAMVVVVLIAGPAPASTRTVRVVDFAFSPHRLTVKARSHIAFVFAGSYAHNVTRLSGPAFRTITDRSSGTVTRSFRRAGTYRLYCSIHGFRLTVVVR